jgi:hypothetical protein
MGGEVNQSPKVSELPCAKSTGRLGYDKEPTAIHSCGKTAGSSCRFIKRCKVTFGELNDLIYSLLFHVPIRSIDGYPPVC